MSSRPQDVPRTPAASGRARRWGVRLASVLRGVLYVVVAGGVLAAAAAYFVYRHFEADLPSIGDIKGGYKPPQVTRLLARDGALLAEIFTERRTVVPIAAVSPAAKLAVLAAEDAEFYEHEGLNYWGMLRALIVDLRARRTRQGGSSITQQVVKNVVLDPARSVRRKIREAILARRIEQRISKDEILEIYLNQIYFGHGRYGIEEAARFYFGKSSKDVTVAEAAMLAGLVAGPELYSPRKDIARAERRRAWVLGQMLDKGFIDRPKYDAAMTEPVRLAAPNEPLDQLVPEVVEIAKRTLKEALGELPHQGGYTIQTSIDPKLQALARKAVRDNLDAYAKRYKIVAPFKAPPVSAAKKKAVPRDKPFEGTPKYGDHKVLVGVVVGSDDVAGTIDVRVGTIVGTVKLADNARYDPQHLLPSRFAEDGALLRVSLLAPFSGPDAKAPGGAKVPLRLELAPEGAMVVLDVRTREVLALVGGYEPVSGGLDRATQAHRQPGSSFKPFVYSYALYTRRFTPATMLDTNPGTLGAYKPSNYEDSEGAAPMRLREALAKSVNVAAVHVLSEVGPANVVTWAQALGIRSKLGPDLSLALGSYEVTPYEMAGAYATFASGGVYEAPVVVMKITAPDGRDVPLPPHPPARRVMAEAEAHLTTSLLGSVIDHGTAASARVLGRPVAGKTGTSNQAKDAWFIGYSTDIVCATWTGYDEPRSLGAREAGATAALPAWISFMKGAHDQRPPTEFPRPAGIVSVRIDPATGLLAYEGEEDAIDELFLEGTAPEVASVPDAGARGDGAVVVGTAVAEETALVATDAGAPAAALVPTPTLPRPEEPPPF
jgi:penicillin-binding protein 1A